MIRPFGSATWIGAIAVALVHPEVLLPPLLGIGVLVAGVAFALGSKAWGKRALATLVGAVVLGGLLKGLLVQLSLATGGGASLEPSAAVVVGFLVGLTGLAALVGIARLRAGRAHTRSRSPRVSVRRRGVFVEPRHLPPAPAQLSTHTAEADDLSLLGDDDGR